LIDISLTDDGNGQVLMHRPDCEMVARHRRDGKLVATLFGLKEMPEDVRRHSCMMADDKEPQS
jgi:hypothetical protein